MVLTPALEDEFAQAVDEFEERYKMKYVTSFERRGHRIGFEEGLEQGLERGLEQGIVRVLTQRFGTVSEELQQRINEASVSQLESLLDEAAVVPDLETFTNLVDDILN
jgi:flagellar biosynthesis/type III secretory pathway protein FliH